LATPENSMFCRKLRSFASFALLGAVFVSPPFAVLAQGLPPEEVLNAIFPNEGSSQGTSEQIGIHFERDKADTDAKCGLQPVRLIETKGDERRSFSLLADAGEAPAANPSTFLVRLSRLTVDIDGSGRSYHPNDPAGGGVCTEIRSHGRVSLQGVCALAPLSSAEVKVFLGVEPLRIFLDGKPNPNFMPTWSDLWTDIKSRRLQRADLKAYLGEEEAQTTALFYKKETNSTVVFDTKIIPFRNGYPCVHESGPYKGYFVASTTLKRPPASLRANACDASRFMDALRVPFVVIPTGVFKNVAVGDIAIGYAKIGQIDRAVFGIVGDTGPVGKFGEASVAFINRLLKLQDEPMNSIAVDRLDVDLESPEPQYKDVSSIAVLVIGNTAKLLAGNYSPANIEKIGRRTLARWSAAAGPQRLSSCVETSQVNRLTGEANQVRAPN
jgi:hypothetical protein